MVSDAALAIYDVMMDIPCPVSTVCFGRSNLFSTLILAAGHKGLRYATRTSSIDTRFASIYVPREAAPQDRSTAYFSEGAAEFPKMLEKIYSRFQKCTGLTEHRLFELVNSKYPLSAFDAQSFRIIDRILDAPNTLIGTE